MSEHLQEAPGGPGLPGHPELEELAALADGRLSPADALRVRAHLDSCEDCFEVFTETLHLMEELAVDQDKPEKTGRVVLPFPFDKTWTRWGAVAALLVLGVGVGLWSLRGDRSGLSVAALAQPLAQRGIEDKLALGEIFRGGSKGQQAATEATAFQVGAALFNLQVALLSDDLRAADAAAAQMNGILGIGSDTDPRDGAPVSSTSPYLEASIRNFLGGLRVRLGREEPRRLAKEAERQAKDLRASATFVDDQPYVDLGMWTAAARLAAAEKRPFRQRKEAGALLKRLKENQGHDPDADLPGKVVTALGAIRGLPEKDFSSLEARSRTIFDHYYRPGRPVEGSP